MSDKTTEPPCAAGELCYLCDGSCGADLDEYVAIEGVVQLRAEAIGALRAKESDNA